MPTWRAHAPRCGPKIFKDAGLKIHPRRKKSDDWLTIRFVCYLPEAILKAISASGSKCTKEVASAIRGKIIAFIRDSVTTAEGKLYKWL